MSSWPWDYYRVPLAEVLSHPCPYCRADPHMPCVGAGGFPHISRRGIALRARQIGENRD